MIYKYFGPPGTGKTHKLISRAKAYVRTGVPLHKIGYFAFSKKAAEVAKKRMPADEKQLPYFQTIHSFCFHFLKMNEEDIMQPYHYEKFGQEINVKVKYTNKYNKEEVHYLTCDNPYFQILQKAENKCIQIEDEYDLHKKDKSIDWPILRDISRNFIKYKDKKNLFDFNDLIKLTIDKKDDKDFPTFKTIFIDEAQDLSPLQWKLFDVLREKTEDIYLAGDDDQAIFAWAGADVNRFINQEAYQEKVLKYSKRISRVIQDESQIAIERISNRKNKIYYPRDFEGESEFISNINQVDLTKGKWLILTRTVSRQEKIKEELKKKNLYFETSREKSYKVKLYKAAMLYTDWVNKKILSEKEEKSIEEFLGTNYFDRTIDWFDQFMEADEKEKLYIKNMLDEGEDLDKPARIYISTIHAAKGGEEDNVILCLDMGRKIIKSIKESEEYSDEENRVWYVGITRAKNNLYKLKAKINRQGYKL
jgi:superfamily I DNA/RNA helicase